MKLFDTNQKKRGKRGEGRTVIFKPLHLPEDLVHDLKVYKSLYEIKAATEKDESGYPIPVRIPFEKMFRHWMDNVRLFDPDIYWNFESSKRKGYDQPEYGVVDPTEGDIWEMEYTFYRDGDEVKAFPDPECMFYAIVDGERRTMKEMLNDEWELMNEAGIDIDPFQARDVSRILLEHQK